MIDFWSKAVQKKKSKVSNESLSTVSYEKIEFVTINDKTNPQRPTEISSLTTNTAAPTLALEKVKQKVNTINNIVHLYWKRNL